MQCTLLGMLCHLHRRQHPPPTRRAPPTTYTTHCTPGAPSTGPISGRPPAAYGRNPTRTHRGADAAAPVGGWPATLRLKASGDTDAKCGRKCAALVMMARTMPGDASCASKPLNSRLLPGGIGGECSEWVGLTLLVSLCVHARTRACVCVGGGRRPRMPSLQVMGEPGARSGLHRTGNTHYNHDFRWEGGHLGASMVMGAAATCVPAIATYLSVCCR